MKLRTVVRRTVRQKVTRPARRKICARMIIPVKRRIRREVRKRPLFTCGSCGKSYSNPFGHTCANAGDFGKRRRAAERARKAEAAKAKRAAERQRVNERVAAARKKERERAAQRVSAARRAERAKAQRRAAKAKAARKPARRTGRPAHDYTRCRDHDCTRQACEAYREGRQDEAEATDRAQ